MASMRVLVTSHLIFVAMLMWRCTCQQDDRSPESSNAGNIITWEDNVEDSLFDPIQADPDCEVEGDADCWNPPSTTIEQVTMDASCSFGGDDPDQDKNCDEDAAVVDHIDKPIH